MYELRHCLALLGLLGIVLSGCSTPVDPDPESESAESDTVAAQPSIVDDDREERESIETWVKEATAAAGHGAATLLRFAIATRHPEADRTRECVPPFAGALRDDPAALADPDVVSVGDGRYRVGGTNVSVEVAVTSGRAMHLERCGGPDELLAEADKELAQQDDPGSGETPVNEAGASREASPNEATQGRTEAPSTSQPPSNTDSEPGGQPAPAPPPPSEPTPPTGPSTVDADGQALPDGMVLPEADGFSYACEWTAAGVLRFEFAVHLRGGKQYQFAAHATERTGSFQWRYWAAGRDANRVTGQAGDTDPSSRDVIVLPPTDRLRFLHSYGTPSQIDDSADYWLDIRHTHSEIDYDRLACSGVDPR